MGLFKILVTEDNSNDFILLERAFQKAGLLHRLPLVEDRAQVIAHLEGSEPFTDRTAYPIPDFLLLELNMPRLDGFEVLEWIRKHPRFCVEL